VYWNTRNLCFFIFFSVFWRFHLRIFLRFATFASEWFFVFSASFERLVHYSHELFLVCCGFC
jgi:hypothetical protein